MIRSWNTFSPAIRSDSRIGSRTAVGRVVTDMADPLGAARGEVQAEIKSIEIAPAPGIARIRYFSIHNERHLLLRQAAVRAQRHFKARQIMPLPTRTDHRILLRDDNEIPDPIRRQL